MTITAGSNFHAFIDPNAVTSGGNIPYNASDIISLLNEAVIATIQVPNATSYSASGLPPGLTWDSKTGRVSGTPTQSGAFPITVTASTPTGSVLSTFTLYIADSNADSEPLKTTYTYDKTNRLTGARGAIYDMDGEGNIKSVKY